MKKEIMVGVAAILVGLPVLAKTGARGTDKDDQSESAASKSTVAAKKKKTQKAFQFEPSVSLGYTDNVFMTPTGTYEDPETGNPANSDPTSSMLVELRPKVSFDFINKKKSSLILENDLKGKIFLYGDNASNANGFDNTTSLVWEKEVGSAKNGLAHQFDVGVFYDLHDYKYLHRGTGATRVTSASQTDEEGRYAYSGPGAEAEYEIKTNSDFKGTLGLGYAVRDYKEVSGLKSYDRDIFTYGIELDQEFQKTFAVEAGYEFSTILYKDNDALDATGSSVVGTDREYQDTEMFLKLSFEPKRQKYSVKYESKTREDMYVNYYGYEQGKIALKAEYEYRKDRHVGAGFSQATRDYELETDPNGTIRDREVNEIDVEWGIEKKDSSLTIQYASKDQDDTDAYYTFKRNIVMAEWQKEF